MTERVFSGMQPTGAVHLGNYLGAMRQWVQLQDEVPCIFCIVDYHAITMDYSPAELPGRVLDLAVSLLAVGLDPERCTIFVQSAVPQHAELAWLLNTVAPLGDLERMTQFKDKARELEWIPAGLLNYPVLQAADILLYRATQVPVGEDQVQHLELTREIARRWNRQFGSYFPEPQAVVSDVGRVRGLDGSAKMSKSRGNSIGLLDDAATIRASVGTAVTDPTRVRRDDPGRPEVCNVYSLHRQFSTGDAVSRIDSDCRGAAIGCVDCKAELAESLVGTLEPIRDRAEELRAMPEQVCQVLEEGASRCRRLADETLAEVRDRMGLGCRRSAPTGAC